MNKHEAKRIRNIKYFKIKGFFAIYRAILYSLSPIISGLTAAIIAFSILFSYWKYSFFALIPLFIFSILISLYIYFWFDYKKIHKKEFNLLLLKIQNQGVFFKDIENNLYNLEQKNIIGCYIIMNLSNNKCYIGQSKNVYKRLKDYFYGKNHNWKLQYDIRNNINIFKIKII